VNLLYYENKPEEARYASFSGSRARSHISKQACNAHFAFAQFEFAFMQILKLK
jgi:hypothetical protein